MSGAPTPSQFRKMSDFQTQGVIKTLGYHYRAIEKRHIFDRVSLDRSPEPREASLAADYDYLIFFDLVSWQHSQWYVRAKGRGKPHSIYMDTSRPEGPGRTIAWLASLAEEVRKWFSPVWSKAVRAQ